MWFYQLNLNRTLGKTNPLTETDLEEFVTLQKSKAESENSWSVAVSELDENCDLSVKNPHRIETVDERTPQEIVGDIQALADDSRKLLDEILGMI